MKIAVVGDNEIVLGFRLAGLKLTRTVRNTEETIDALEYFIDHQNVGIILLQSSMASIVRTYLANKIHNKKVYPIILEIEDRATPDVWDSFSGDDVTAGDPGLYRR